MCAALNKIYIFNFLLLKTIEDFVNSTLKKSKIDHRFCILE